MPRVLRIIRITTEIGPFRTPIERFMHDTAQRKQWELAKVPLPNRTLKDTRGSCKTGTKETVDQLRIG